MFEFISYGISCLTCTYITLNFFKNMFKSKYNKKYLNVILGIPISIIWFFISLMNKPFFNFSYFMIVCSITEYFFYNINIKEIFQTVFFIICYTCCDVLISSIFIIINKPYTKNSFLFLINVLLVQILMMCIYKILLMLLKNLKSNYFHEKQILFLFIFPCLNILVFYLISIISDSYWNQTKIEIVVLLMGVIATILNFSAVYFFGYIAKTNKLESDLSLIEQQTTLQYNYYKNLEIKYDNMQKIIHDIKHHINVMNKLYASDPKAGNNYSKRLNDIIKHYSLKFKCKNSILNIIINEKINICEKENIAFDYSVEDINLDFIDNIDLTSLFTNLLDNAVEACKKIKGKDKCIELRIYKFNKMLVINVINTIGKQPLKVNDEFISSRANHKAIGLKNVKLIVEKYDGDINIETEQGKFSVSIICPVPN